MKTRAHVFVAGQVQGVFFRSETAKEASMVGVSGWVRNLPDGRVEAVFEGEKSSVDVMLEFCRSGPPHAEVKSVDVQWEDYRAEYVGFQIRR